MTTAKVRIAGTADVVEGQLLSVQAAGKRMLLSRINGRAYAVVDRCPHMGMSIAKGKLNGGVVTCPWHNSRFDFCSGRNLDWVSAIMGVPMPGWTHKAIAMGKSPAPLDTLAVHEVNGDVFVEV